MIVVIFELWPAKGATQCYFDIAASLRDELHVADGFISVERFKSVAISGKYLSLSFWRDEDAVKLWRNRRAHRMAQTHGREGVFADYRLRVASVVRDYGMTEREQVPKDSDSHHG